jgi:twinkle protein
MVAERMSDPIAQVKATVQIEEYARTYLRLELRYRPGSKDWLGRCPFHAEKTPSFHIRPTEQDFKCFGCNVGGDVIDLFMAATGEVNARTAAERILAEVGEPLRTVGPVTFRPKARAPIEPGPEELSDEGLRWLTTRGIRPSVALRNGVTADKTTLHMPYVRDGAVAYVQTRQFAVGADGKKRMKWPDGVHPIPFGLDECAGEREVLIVEGVMDKLAIEEATGRKAVLAMPSATPGPDAYEMTANALKAARKVLAVDSDSAGQKLQAELIKRLGAAKCWLVTWPDGIKDANDALLNGSLLPALDGAQALPVAGVFSFSDDQADVLDLYRNGLPPGWSTGWMGMDRLYRVRPGCLSVVTGVPSSGKSVWLDALLVNLMRSGKRFAVCSPEMHPRSLHWARLAQLQVGMPFRDGPSARMSEEELQRAGQWLDERLWFVAPEEPTLDSVIETLEVAQVRHGVDGWVIDPWNDLIHPKGSEESGTEYIHQRVAELKRRARDFDVHVWVVVHPTKMFPNADGTWPVPHPYNAAGSAAWYDKPDCFLTVWRDKTRPEWPVQVHVQKMRWDWDGELGMAEFRYDKVTGRYTEVNAF